MMRGDRKERDLGMTRESELGKHVPMNGTKGEGKGGRAGGAVWRSEGACVDVKRSRKGGKESRIKSDSDGSNRDGEQDVLVERRTGSTGKEIQSETSLQRQLWSHYDGCFGLYLTNSLNSIL